MYIGSVPGGAALVALLISHRAFVCKTVGRFVCAGARGVGAATTACVACCKGVGEKFSAHRQGSLGEAFLGQEQQESLGAGSFGASIMSWVSAEEDPVHGGVPLAYPPQPAGTIQRSFSGEMRARVRGVYEGLKGQISTAIDGEKDLENQTKEVRRQQKSCLANSLPGRFCTWFMMLTAFGFYGAIPITTQLLTEGIAYTKEFGYEYQPRLLGLDEMAMAISAGKMETDLLQHMDSWMHAELSESSVLDVPSAFVTAQPDFRSLYKQNSVGDLASSCRSLWQEILPTLKNVSVAGGVAAAVGATRQPSARPVFTALKKVLGGVRARGFGNDWKFQRSGGELVFAKMQQYFATETVGAADFQHCLSGWGKDFFSFGALIH